MKKNIIHLSILLVALFSFTAANAQMLERNDMIYNSSILPQANYYNPAFFQPNRDIYITLPSYSISEGLPVAYSDLHFVKNMEKGKTKYKLDLYSLAENLQNDKSIHLGTTVNVFGFGFHINKMFFTFNASANVNGSLYFPSGLSDIITGGLIRSIGKENASGVVFDKFLSVNAYERFSLGFGYDINKNLTIGIHANLLNGVASACLDDVNAQVWSEDDAYSQIRGTLQYRFLRAGALNYDFETNEFKEFEHTFNNLGYTFDLGVVYRLNKFTFSAALVDVGPGIQWKDNVKEITPKNTDLKFDGNDLGDFMTSGKMDFTFFDGVTDTLDGVLDYVESDYESYWQAIPAKMYVGASYTFNDYFRVNLLFHGEWDNGIISKGEDGTTFFGEGTRMRHNTSLSGSLKVNNMIELMVANAFCFDGEKGSILNPGIGLTLAPANALQLFIMADYISSFKAADIKGTHVQFGLNVCFGHDRTKDAANVVTNDETVL